MIAIPDEFLKLIVSILPIAIGYGKSDAGAPGFYADSHLR
jgi:hypothetical protein